MHVSPLWHQKESLLKEFTKEVSMAIARPGFWLLGQGDERVQEKAKVELSVLLTESRDIASKCLDPNIRSPQWALEDCAHVFTDNTFSRSSQKKPGYGRWNLVRCLLEEWTSISLLLNSFSSFRMAALSAADSLVQGLSALRS